MSFQTISLAFINLEYSFHSLKILSTNPELLFTSFTYQNIKLYPMLQKMAASEGEVYNYKATKISKCSCTYSYKETQTIA